jgi:predicted nucleotidyltransferase
MKVPIFGLPRLTLSERISAVWDQSIIQSKISPKTKHSQNKELIVEVLGGDIYHAVKVHSYIKNKSSLSDSEFTRLKKRCDKIRSMRILLGVFIEIMYAQSYRALLQKSQLEILKSSFPEELNQLIAEAFQSYKRINPVKKNPLYEMLFVLETLYDCNKIDFQKLTRGNIADSNESWDLATLASRIDYCMQRTKRTGEQVFSNSQNREGCKKQLLQDSKAYFSLPLFGEFDNSTTKTNCLYSF